MPRTRTAEVLRMVPALVSEHLRRANSADGAPSERDFQILSKKEQPKLNRPLAEVAADLRADRTTPLKNAEVRKEASRRMRLAIRAVAGKKGTTDGHWLSKAEVERIRDPEMRSMVRDIVELRALLRQWHTKDPELDGVEGASVDRSYDELLGGKPLKEVVVAVIDSGVDIHHPDLEGKIWTNPGEIPGNGIDDDGNGYVDDVHGWSFLGTVDKDGKPVNLHEVTLEVTREVIRLEKLAEERPLTRDEKKLLRAARKEVKAGLARETKRGGSTHYYDVTFDDRARIIGDDPNDFSDHDYGNNDVIGPNPRHGTHVAGTIAAVRNNDLGFDGIAENVKIMSVRAVPDGDEYDKDVANAIRYAVDNGADIINMSFGKSYSPHKDEVVKAMRYAFEHGVLMVHAAGNSGEDLDVDNNFPTANKPGSPEIGTWLEVGAMSAKTGATFPAAFSNFGDNSVDLFSPGVHIDATLPKGRFGALNGTSMATPVVAGVLALMKSACPDADAGRLRTILLESVRKYPGLKVWAPYRKTRTRTPVDFSDLSKTGGVVDARAAIARLLDAKKA